MLLGPLANEEAIAVQLRFPNEANLSHSLSLVCTRTHLMIAVLHRHVVAHALPLWDIDQVCGAIVTQVRITLPKY